MAYRIEIANPAYTHSQYINSTVSGTEAAYTAYKLACEFADITGLKVSLYNAITNELITTNED